MSGLLGHVPDLRAPARQSRELAGCRLSTAGMTCAEDGSSLQAFARAGDDVVAAPLWPSDDFDVCVHGLNVNAPADATETLTNAERTEVARFGIHDLDILAAMEEHADDVVPCIQCGQESSHAIICRGQACTVRVTICANHLAQVRAANRRLTIRCDTCGFRAPGTGIDSAAKVVPL